MSCPFRLLATAGRLAGQFFLSLSFPRNRGARPGFLRRSSLSALGLLLAFALAAGGSGCSQTPKRFIPDPSMDYSRGMFHRVRDGECLSSIARYFRRDVRSLARFNDLRPPYVIRTNTHLYIPPLGGAPFLREYRISLDDIRLARRRLDRGWDGKTKLWKKAEPARLPARAVPSTPTTKKRTVAKSLVAVPMKKARTMKTRVLASAPKRSTAKTAAAPARLPSKKPVVAKASVPKSVTKPAPSSRSRTAPKAASTKASPKSSRKFMWPLDRYRYLSGFSTNWYDKNFGIDLGASEGTAIHAIEGGKVLRSISSEKELRDMHMTFLGHMIVVDHGGGFTSVYAGMSKNLVRSDDRVKRGQIIGLVGSTGKSAEGPHLHFQIRYNGEARDPEKYLPRRSGSATLLASKKK